MAILLLMLLAVASAGRLTVEVLDIGQGDSILLTTEGGKRVLIDGGTGRVDPVPFLERRQVDKIDLMIATHPHADHIGGLDEVLEAVPVRVFTDNGLPHTTQSYAKVMELVEDKGITYRTAEAGQAYNLDDGVRIEILHPQLNPLTGTRSDLNSNSVVARVTHGSNCFLFTGDSEDPTERVLMQNGIGKCNVLKVAHHGSEHSTSDAWLRAVQPSVALISCGSGNRYGHPDEHALDRLAAAGAAVYRTDEQGTLKVISDGKHIEVLTNVDPVTAPSASRPMVGTPSRMQAGSTYDTVVLNDLNTAPAADLTRLSGVGPAKAEAIVAYRTEHGPFPSLDAVTQVPGIGPGTLAQMRQPPSGAGRVGESALASSRGGARGTPDMDRLKQRARVSAAPAASEAATAPPAARVGAPTGSLRPQIDLNTASLAQLDTLPGIGPAKAQAIVSWRTEHGPFTSFEQLDDVPGIGPATMAQLESLVTIGTQTEEMP